jgi:cytochrome c556
MRRKLVLAIAATISTLGLSFAVFADTTPQDAFEYRSAVMTSLRGHIVAVSKTVRGQVEDNGFLVKHAEGLANGVAEMEYIFQKGSDVTDSDALPVIWEDTEKFAAAIEQAKTATQAFVEVAASGDRAAIGAAFRDVGGSCRGCHDNFRVSDD